MGWLASFFGGSRSPNRSDTLAPLQDGRGRASGTAPPSVAPARVQSPDAATPELNELLQRTLFASGWSWRTDARGRTTFVSESFESVTGVAPAAILGKNEWLEDRFLEPLMADRLEHATRAQREFSGIVFRQDFPSGGAPAWHVTEAVPSFDQNGVFDGYWGVTRDISARKRAEERLQESEARYRQLADAASDWFWATNPQHQFCELSAPQLKAGAIPQLGRCRWEIEGADLPENDWAAHRAVLKERLPFRDFEFARDARSGERHWIAVSGAPRFDSAGTFLGYQGTGRYVTERKLAELKLAQSEQRYRRLAALGADWEWASDAQHRFLSFSKGAEAIFGYERNPSLGFARWEVPGVSPDAPDWDGHRRLLDAHKPFRNFVYPRLGEEGMVFWTSASGDPIFDGRGAFIGYEGTARDVTAATQAQVRLERLMKLYAALSDVNRDLADAGNPEEAFTVVCRTLYEMGGLVRATYFEYDESENVLRVAQHAGSEAPVNRVIPVPARREAFAHDLPTVRALFDGRTQVVNDYVRDPTTRPFHALARKVGVAAALLVPVRVHERVLGVLMLYASERDWFDNSLRDLGERVGTVLSQSLTRFALEKSAQIANRELATSERHYRQFVELTTDWHLETDCDGLLTYLSDAYAAYTGEMLEGRIGKRIFSPPNSIDANRLEEFWVLFRARQPVRDFLVQVRGLAGEPWWRINAAPRYDPDGSYLGYAGTTRDVSAEIRATVALRAAEAHFQQLAQRSVDWNWQTDATGRISLLSDSYRRNTGFDPAGRLGQPAFLSPEETLFDDPQDNANEQFIREAMQARRAFFNQTHARWLNPGQRENQWRISSGEPLFSPTGEFLGYRGISRDVTQEVLTRRALRTCEERLHEARQRLVDAGIVPARADTGVGSLRAPSDGKGGNEA